MFTPKFMGGATVLKVGVFDPPYLASGGQNIAWISQPNLSVCFVAD